MRELTDHILNAADRPVIADDQLGAEGLPQRYRIDFPGYSTFIDFAHVSEEALLTILIDRIKSKQLKSWNSIPVGLPRPLPSQPEKDLGHALSKCQEALWWLHSHARTKAALEAERSQSK